MIRRATESDIPVLLEMGKRFHDAANLSEIPFDGESVERTMRNLLASDDALLLIADGGMAAAMCYPAYFNLAHRQAQELFWWVDEEKRASGLGRALLKEIESWASEKAETLTMICLDSLEPERVSALYKRAGYLPLERSFIKRF